MRHVILILVVLLGAAQLLVCAETSPAPVRLRILSYNIRHGQGMDGLLDLDRTAGVITAADADLVALQEIEVGSRRSGQVDQPRHLAEAAQRVPVFGKAIDHAGGGYGNALLARSAPEQVQVVPLPGKGERRCCIRAAVRIPGLEVPVIVIATHLSHDGGAVGDGQRLEQMKAILATLADVPAMQPVIIAGDLNAVPDAPVMRYLEDQGWVRLTATCGPTHPADTPRDVIDHILLRPGAWSHAVEAAVVLDQPVASDHRPLMATIQLTRRP